MEVSEAQLSALIQQQVNALLLTQKDSGTSGLAIAPHGYNALFNNFGIEPGVPTTYIGPKGLEQALVAMGHVQKSQLLNPVFEILTGQTESSGTEPTTPCTEDVPTPGDLKVCHQTWPFGEFTMKTKPIRVDNAGELINRSEILDLRLLNNPFAEANNIIPTGTNNLFRNKLTKAVVELTNDFSRRYARLFYTGSPVNTAASSGGYLEYNGMERIVNDSYQDVFTGTACSAANSLIVAAPSGVMQNNAATYVQALVETYRAQKYLADQLLISDVQFAWVMRYQAFLSLTQIWPCAYETYRCFNASPSGSSIVIDTSAADQNAMRNDMRNGHFLLIDGERVPVIIDNTMAEANIGR
jgi:hypothetical protein